MKLPTFSAPKCLLVPLGIKFFILILLLFPGCPKPPAELTKSKATPASRAEVLHFCADCHAYPHPETFPTHLWREEVEQGFAFYEQSQRTDLTVPDKESVVAYYEGLAPEGLRIPLPDNPRPTGPVNFGVQHLNFADAPTPAVSHISQTGFPEKSATSLVVSDMREGQVSLLSFVAGQPSLETIAEVPFPAHTECCDLNGDGLEDWLVSDLGSYAPEDHDKGQLIWFQLSSNGDYEKSSILLKNVGRIADARTADFDNDGDLDIAVAVFGWRRTGKLIWLEQVPSSSDELQFEEHLLSKRHGCSHVPIADINLDGRPDIVALFSQEFESIEAYLNEGSGTFKNTILFRADDPSYGSSSIDVTDLDDDGDIDVLYTNGDSLDSHLIKPYHSVQWLEQLPDLEFTRHTLTQLPGAYCVKAGDIDGDGDEDLVASTMTLNFDHSFHSLIWLEQTDAKVFVRHEIETSLFQHACLELGDFDQDSDLDIIVGHFEPRPVQESLWTSIWWNDGKAGSPRSD